MNIRSRAASAMALPFILIAFSCASAPPKPSTAPTTAPAAQTPDQPKSAAAAETPKAAVPAPDAQKAAAEKARAEAAAYDAAASFPDAWKSASDDFAAGDGAYGKDNDASRGAYEKSAAGFVDLAAKAKPVFLDSLAKAREKAEAARKEAFDVDAKSFLPDDWASAEASFLKGREGVGAAEGGTLEAYIPARAAYLDAGAAYAALLEKALPLYAGALKPQSDKARADAVAAGAPDLAAERFGVAETAAAAAQTAFEAKDFRAAYDGWKDARDRYYVLAVGCRAGKVKAEIDRRGFASYDSGNYLRASDRLGTAEAAYDSGSIAAAKEAVEESHLRFKLALAKGSELYAGDRSKAAAEKKAAATELKAQVAVRADYEAASDTLSAADAAYKESKWDDASDLYTQAEERFGAVAETAAQKREAALKAMDDAKKRMADSQRSAAAADAVLQGGAR